MSVADEIFVEYIEPIQHRMMTSIYRIVQDPDDAADAFQNALFKIWNYLERIMNHPNPQGYIMNICTSCAYDVLKKRVKQSNHEVSIEVESVIPFPIQEPLPASREIVMKIQQTLASMPMKQAQAVFLRIFEDESFRAIGEIIGCSEATARSHVSKGLAALRALLLEQNISFSEAHIS